MLKESETQSLESYMAQIAHELRALPSQARAEEMREIESHLRAMIEARGDVAAVLAQFGAPRRVGRDLRRAWERKQPEIWWRIILAPIIGFVIQTLSSILIAAVVWLDSYFSWDDKIQAIIPDSAIGYFYMFLMLFSYSMANIITGFTIGVISPKRGKWIIAAYFLSTLMILASQAFNQGFSIFDAGEDVFSSIWFVIGTYVVTIFLSIYGVHFGARRERQQKRFARFIGLE